jgi:hypothetical protein
METRRIIRTDIAASAIAHLTLVALIIVVSEVHPFHAPQIETVAVDIVTTDDLKDKAPEPAPPPQQMPMPDLSTPGKDAAPPQQEQQQSQAPPAPPPQESSQRPPPAPPSRREANAPPPARSAPQAPSYKPPEPDVTIKYGVMLGLPEELPPLPKDSSRENDGGDAKDSMATRLPPDIVAQFRRHLRTCAKLPASIAPSDNVHVKLRAVMTTDGMLARAPILIEASASTKGPLLMQSARNALEACQPYTMLPADKYQEWKVLDLTFTPHDFNAS